MAANKNLFNQPENPKVILSLHLNLDDKLLLFTWLNIMNNYKGKITSCTFHNKGILFSWSHLPSPPCFLLPNTPIIVFNGRQNKRLRVYESSVVFLHISPIHLPTKLHFYMDPSANSNRRHLGLVYVKQTRWPHNRSTQVQNQPGALS